MSFSSDVKNELARCEIQTKCCSRAELLGIISFCGTYKPSPEEVLTVKTENAAVARRVFSLIKKLFGENITINQTKKKSRGSTFSIELTDSLLFKVLTETGLNKDGIVKFVVDPFLVQDECCARSFLRGAFLGGGSVNSPEKSYHLEIETHYFGLSQSLTEIMNAALFGAKTIVRKSNYVTYIKDSEKISDILAAMGATDSMLELCNIKIMKDMKNSVNRRVNCETANVVKTASAAMHQTMSIKKIIDKKGIESLPDGLKELALLRLENPEASLSELTSMLKTPISRSGVNHRFKKLMQIADSL
ncbi:MAG: DNA-binding protein WhiA [Clostridia bacterium]|nr:DNA-binding protein WhiA [Clostridia bacterium]